MSKSTIGTLEKVWNKVKVNNKDTRTTSLKSFSCFYCYFWKYFTPFSRVSISDFEQVNVSWKALSITYSRSLKIRKSYAWHKGSSPNFASNINWITKLLIPLKSLENHRFSNDFSGNRNKLILLNLLNVRHKIWWRSLIPK